MTRRLKVVHRTGFSYPEPVVASYNEARMTPPSTTHQSVLETGLQVDPVSWSHVYRDYWGAQVTAFEVLVPHERLDVVASSTVEVHGPTPGAGAGWDVVLAPRVQDSLVEFVTATPATVCPDDLGALAREAAAGLAPGAAARAVCDGVHAELAYVPGATSVHTGAQEAWDARKGVCQDFAHVTVAALRSLGLPARYVSGYLHPEPDAPVGRTVQGQSHAWVEWWEGAWCGYDPTHAAPAGADHVVVAQGRDYGDVTPLKGIFSGPRASELYVSVEVTRLV